MRIGIIGDVHAEDVALASALERFRGEKVDSVLCVGDVADGQGNLERCIELLEDHGVLTVRGNHDRWIVADRVRDLPHAHRRAALSARAIRFFEALPTTRTLDTPCGPLLLCHGVGEDDMQRLMPDDDGYALASNFELQKILMNGFRIAVGGHTHRRMVRDFGQLRFINAGTLARGHEPCFGVVTLEEERAIEAAFYDL